MNFSGSVIIGDGIGRKIGFPTINLFAPELETVLEGVFAVWFLWKNFCVKGVMHVGKRPTLNKFEFRVEVHLLSVPKNFPFAELFAGEKVKIFVGKKIRGVQKFENVDALKVQIAKDILKSQKANFVFFANKNFRSAFFFAHTLYLAKKGGTKVLPNPQVGAVIVKKNRIVGKGFHQFFGGLHAEPNAIFDAEKNGFSVQNAEIFVSLEPCCHHHKKTPPCTELLISKKISKVNILYEDPNPKVAGKGILTLKNAGMMVKNFPLLAGKKNFYTVFSHLITQKTAFCTLKLAQSADGFLGKMGEKTTITGEKFREKVLQWRDEHQAILVGANTILVDDCVLSGKKTEPIRLVFLKEWNAEFLTKKFFRDKNVLIVTFAGNSQNFSSFCDFPILEIAEKNGQPDFLDMKKKLFERGIFSVFVEGGGKTAQEMLAQNAIEKVILAKTSQKFSNGVVGISAEHLKNFVLQQQKKRGDESVCFFVFPLVIE